MRVNKTSGILSRKGSTSSQAPDRQSENSFIYSNAGLARRQQPRDWHPIDAIISNLYEKRLDIFSESLIKIIEQVESDELISTLKQDSSTSNYISLRVKEILDEHFKGDRERYIKDLLQEYAGIKTELVELRESHRTDIESYQDLAAEMNSHMKQNQRNLRICEELEAENRLGPFLPKKKLTPPPIPPLHHPTPKLEAIERAHQVLLEEKEDERSSKLRNNQTLENLITNTTRDNKELWLELERQKNRNSELEEDWNSMKDEMSNLKDQLKLSADMLTTLEDANNKQKDKIRLLKEENSDLKDRLKEFVSYRQLEERSQRSIQNETENFMEEMNRLKQKYKEKVSIYKQKFVDFRKRFNDAEKEMGYLKRLQEDERISWRDRLSSNDERVKDIQEEYETKLTRIQEQSLKTIEDLKLRHQESLNELKDKYENILRDNITKFKSEEDREKAQLKSKVELYNTNYIKISDHEQVIQDMEERISQLEERISQLEEIISQLEKEKQDLEFNFGDTLVFLKEKDNKLSDIEYLLTDAKRNIEELNSERIKAQDQCQILGQDLEMEKKRNNQMSDQLAKALREKDDLIKKNSELSNAVDLKTKEVQQAGLKHESENEGLKKAVEGLRQEVLMKNADIDNKSGEVSRLQRSLAEISEKSKRDASEMRDQLKLIDGQKTEMLNSLKETVDSQQNEIRELNERLLTVVKEENSKRQKDLAELYEAKSQLKTAQLEIKSLLDEQGRLQNDILKERTLGERMKEEIKRVEEEQQERSLEFENEKSVLERNLLNTKIFYQEKLINMKNEAQGLITLCRTQFITELKQKFLQKKENIWEFLLSSMKEFSFKMAKNSMERENKKSRQMEKIEGKIEEAFRKEAEQLKNDFYRNETKMIRNYEGKLAYQQETIDKLNEENKLYKEELCLMEEQMSKEINLLQKNIYELSDELTKCENKFNQDRFEMEKTHSSELMELSKIIEVLKGNNQALKERIKLEKNNQVQQNEEKERNAFSKIEELKGFLESSEKNEQNLLKNSKRQNQQIEQLELELRNQKKVIEALNKRLSTAEQVDKDVESEREIEYLRKIIERLEDTLKERNEKIAALERRVLRNEEAEDIKNRYKGLAKRRYSNIDVRNPEDSFIRAEGRTLKASNPQIETNIDRSKTERKMRNEISRKYMESEEKRKLEELVHRKERSILLNKRYSHISDEDDRGVIEDEHEKGGEYAERAYKSARETDNGSFIGRKKYL